MDNLWVVGIFQADVCHAYQILKRGGLKDENIVVFMYDDIAHNSENPYPGKIINKPDGPDVYQGVPKVRFVFELLHNFPYKVELSFQLNGTSCWELFTCDFLLFVLHAKSIISYHLWCILE